MVYLNNCTTNFNYSNSQRVNYRNKVTNPAISDSVSFSGANASDNKKKKNNLIAWIIGGVVLLAGAAILIKARKNKILSSPTKNAGENLTSKGTNNTGTNELTHLNDKMEQQLAETAELEKQLANSKKNIDNPPSLKTVGGHKKASSTIPTIGNKPQPPTKPTSTVKPATIDEQANQAYTQYAHKLATELKIGEKESLIREVLPDLMVLKNNEDALKAVLEHITPQNKNFVVKTAVPAVLRNSKTLDLGKAMGETLSSISPDTVDCLDKLATNAKAFKINSQVDSLNLMKSLTKDNKDFAFNELFPLLAKDMDKYKIRQGGIMAQYLDVVTPKNKEFVLNEALPTIFKHSEALNIDVADALEITKHLNKNNLKNVQVIADNVEKLGLKDINDFLIVDKFVAKLGEK